MFKSYILVAAMFVSGAAMATPSFTIPTLPTPNTNTNSNLNNNANTNLNTNANTNANLNTNTMGQGQSAIGIGGSAHSNSSANNQNSVANSVTVEAQERNPVSTATAPALSVSNGTCMGSTSGGAQGASFGISIGSSWVDEGCDARYDAITLHTIGEVAAAKARLCMKPEIAKAMGEKCDKPKEVSQVQVQATPVVKSNSCGYNGTDPIVRARSGC